MVAEDRALQLANGPRGRFLATEADVRQFPDIGTGPPTAGNVHEAAQAAEPSVRVVYANYDPVVLAHARALLTGSEAGATEYIDADLRNTGSILSQATRLLDFAQPVAVTLIAVLHAIPDSDDPHAIVARLMDAVPSGSHLALSHLGSDLLSREALQNLEDTWRGKIQQQFTWRSREQVARFFEGMELAEPGLVRIEEWRPESGPGETGKSAIWCAVGRKR